MGKRDAVADPVVDALQKELTTVKEQLSAARLVKAKPGSPGAPFPIALQLTVPRPPAAAAFDVNEMKLVLTLEAGGNTEYPVSLVVEASDDIPGQVASAISLSLEATWKQQLTKLQEEGGSVEQRGWLIKPLIGLVVSKFAVLLQLLSEFVEAYMGCDDTGATLRRFMLVSPPTTEAATPGVEEVDAGRDDDEKEEEMDEEGRAFWEEQERKKAEAARKQAIKESQEAEARRQEVERMRDRGIEVDGPRQLSKRELEEQRAQKRGQGQRTAKTGPRASKYAGEGSALAKAEEEKKKGGACKKK